MHFMKVYLSVVPALFLLGACMGPGKVAPAKSSADGRYLKPGVEVPLDRISYRVDSEQTTISGVVTKRRWRKSGLSYCAQGGPFIAIADKGRSTVLLFRDKQLWKAVVDNANRQELKGIYLEKYIPHPKRGAHPVTGGPYYSCRVFEVRGRAE